MRKFRIMHGVSIREWKVWLDNSDVFLGGWFTRSHSVYRVHVRFRILSLYVKRVGCLLETDLPWLMNFWYVKLACYKVTYFLERWSLTFLFWRSKIIEKSSYDFLHYKITKINFILIKYKFILNQLIMIILNR